MVVHLLLPQVVQCGDIRYDVGVRELHALRVSGRTAGVNDGGQVVLGILNLAIHNIATENMIR